MKLSRAQRKALFDGECPTIAFPGDKPCPVEVGHVETLSTHVRLEVTKIRRTRKGEWSLGYTLHDQRLDRTRYLESSTFHSVPMAEDGKPMPMTPEEELGYTTNPARAMDPDAEAVDPLTQARITREARNRDTAAIGDLLVALEDVRAAVKERMENNPEARRLMGRDAWALRAKIDSVERRLRRRAA